MAGLTARLKRAIRRTRTLKIGPVTVVLAGRKTSHMQPLHVIKQQRKYPLAYSEWLSLLTYIVQDNTVQASRERHGCSVRVAYTSGAMPEDVAHLILHGFV